MKRQREQIREELLAVLAASRELTAHHDPEPRVYHESRLKVLAADMVLR